MPGMEINRWGILQIQITVINVETGLEKNFRFFWDWTYWESIKLIKYRRTI